MNRFSCFLIATSLFFPALVLAQANSSVDFKSDIAPIFEQHCIKCHFGGSTHADLEMTSRQKLLDQHSIVPGKPDQSVLYNVVRRGLMPPPDAPKLTADQVAMIGRWIAGGAPWPASVKLQPPASTAKPSESAAVLQDADQKAEQATVRQIRDRILAHEREHASAKAAPYKVTIPNTTVSYSMVPVPAGSFEMGSADSDPQHRKDEQPQHEVRVDGFWMQAHEVTWDEYRLFMFENQAGEVAHKDEVVDGVSRPTKPYVEMSFGMGINGFPAISMTQHAANKYAEWLSAKTGEFYRLPTEAEWEYACRAGTTTPYYFGSDPKQLGEYAWYAANSGGKYQQVATKKPNAWGLYDMLGNVMEWTLDQYKPYKPGPETNPWVKSTTPYPQTARGGSWNDPADMLRCAARVASDASWKQQDPQLPKSIWYETDAQWLGFRLIRPAKVPSAEEMYAYWNNGVEHDEQ
jgi:formylglycine-generating enzyme required for sulfatase activity